MDGLAALEKIAASRPLLPDATLWTPIDGGNHAQFGWYGEQDGDNPATISRETQQEITWEENDLPFIGLPNPDHSVLKRFGQKVKLFKFGRMPAQVIVDKSGTARFAHYGKSMSDIPENEELLGLIEVINAEKADGEIE